jgi:voltage-gated potassium channel
MSILEISPRLATWRRRTDLPLLLLAVGSLPLLLLEVVSHRLTQNDQRFITAVNVIVFIAFAVDYLVELSITYKRSVYVRTQWASLIIVFCTTSTSSRISPTSVSGLLLQLFSRNFNA